MTKLLSGFITLVALLMGFGMGWIAPHPTPAPLPNPSPAPVPTPAPLPAPMIDKELRVAVKNLEDWTKRHDDDLQAKVAALQSARALSDIAAADRLDSLQRAAKDHDDQLSAHEEMFAQVRRNFGKIQSQLTPVRFVRDY